MYIEILHHHSLSLQYQYSHHSSEKREISNRISSTPTHLNPSPTKKLFYIKLYIKYYILYIVLSYIYCNNADDVFFLI